MDALPSFSGSKSIFPLFLGIKVYLYPILRDQIDAFRAEVMLKSILSKNQWELTVSQSSRFLLSLSLLLQTLFSSPVTTPYSFSPIHCWSQNSIAWFIIFFPTESNRKSPGLPWGTTSFQPSSSDSFGPASSSSFHIGFRTQPLTSLPLSQKAGSDSED